MNPVLFASTNRGKFKELSTASSLFGVKVLFPADLVEGLYSEAGIDSPLGPYPLVEETGGTYRENALLKAQAFHDWSKIPSLGDDTGLEVTALNDAPGIYSARYAGARAVTANNIDKLLSDLEQLESRKGRVDRTARFVCVLVLVLGNGKYMEASGELKGEIARYPSGRGGFGYDSVFVVQGYGRTLAELKEKGPTFKTHRILALEKLWEELSSSFSGCDRG